MLKTKKLDDVFNDGSDVLVLLDRHFIDGKTATVGVFCMSACKSGPDSISSTFFSMFVIVWH